MAEQKTSRERSGPSGDLPEMAVPTLEELQHWTWVMGRAQQMMMEHLAGQWGEPG
jgi:polyhydroxyalkanoate synthase subunit PhaC